MTKCWLQRADFSADEREVEHADLAYGWFRDIDWPGELEFMQKLEESGVESCPPGLGVIRDDGAILHLCPNGAGIMSAEVHGTSRLWLFQLFWNADIAVSCRAPGIDQSYNALHLIKLAYGSSGSALSTRVAALATGN